MWRWSERKWNPSTAWAAPGSRPGEGPSTATGRTERKEDPMFSFTMPAADLRDLLSGALLAVSKESTVPVLCAVQLTVEPGSVTVRSTDRYTAVRGAVKCDTDGEGAVLVPSELVARVVKFTLKPVPRSYGAAWTVTVEVDGGQLSARWLDGSSVAGGLAEGSFPQMDSLFPAEGQEGPGIPSVIFDAKRLATLGKLPSSVRHNVLRFRFGASPTKPAVVTTDHDSIAWDVLLMPCRPS